LTGLHQSKIVLVKRGGCNFVTKVRNAQNAGALACLIQDDIEQQSESVVMLDDQSGQDIVTPAFMIRKSDARELS